MYEYLYRIKYQTRFDSENYSGGIPKDEFESLIMEFLPVTADQIEEYAVFDEGSQTYAWASLGCFNYAPTYFGTSIPEVTDIRENEDGKFQYLGNKILNDGISHIPEYQYRIKNR